MNDPVPSNGSAPVPGVAQAGRSAVPVIDRSDEEAVRGNGHVPATPAPEPPRDSFATLRATSSGGAPRGPREALLVRWEEVWYSRWGRLGVLALTVLLTIGGIAFVRPRLATVNETRAMKIVERTTSPVPTPATTASAVPAIVTVAPTAPVGPTAAQGVIVFHSSMETPGALQLYTVRPDGSGLRRIPGTPRNAAHPHLSPDGTRIAFVGNSGDNGVVDDLYIARLDGSELTRVTQGTGNSRFPAWSPDGSRLVFGNDRDGNWEIYTVASDGTNVTRLTASPADDNLPSWSPDGRWIVFQSDRDGGRMHLFRMRTDGSEVGALTTGESSDRYPIWSPDGRRIAFYSDRGGGNDQLFILDPDSGSITQALRTQFRDQLPCWSPDGQWLAFASYRDGNWGIYTVRLRDGAQFLVSKQPDAWAPAWAEVR